MKNPIDIRIEIDPKCQDPVILIRTDQKTQTVEDIIHMIEACTDSSYPLITGYRDSEMELLSQRDIVRVYVEARKVRIRTIDGIYDSRKPLSFLETVLNTDRFIRISRFEIVNIRKISRFDFGMAGTVHILFDDGSVSWAARRYVRAIQQALNRIETGKEE
ncbi:MAG: LytTR family DNA-binding domain-containing protein [Clostridia bacterium]